MSTQNQAAEVNRQLAAIRSRSHNGKIYQDDDVDYLLCLADTMTQGFTAINPQWVRDQAKLVRGTLDLVNELAEACEAVMCQADVYNTKLLPLVQAKMRSAVNKARGVKASVPPVNPPRPEKPREIA